MEKEVAERGGEPDERERKERGAREEHERRGRPSYLRVPIYREQPPGFPFARGPRRFCRLNAINDLIPVITVLIYRARGGSDFLWLCVGGSKMERGRREIHRQSGGGRSFFSSCEQQSRDQLDLTDKTAMSLFVISLMLCNIAKLSIYSRLGSSH